MLLFPFTNLNETKLYIFKLYFETERYPLHYTFKHYTQPLYHPTNLMINVSVVSPVHINSGRHFTKKFCIFKAYFHLHAVLFLFAIYLHAVLFLLASLNWANTLIL